MPASGNLSLGIKRTRAERPALRPCGDRDGQAGRAARPTTIANEFLNRVTDDLYAEIARRFDPTIDDTDLPGTADDMALFQIIPAWRETAWRNAERLVSAESPEDRAAVAASIEAYAESQADTIRLAQGYGPLRNSASRDAYCSVHNDV